MAPVSVGVGGTPLPGVDYAQQIQISIPQGAKLVRSGFEPDAVKSVKMLAPPVCTLFVPAQGGDAETLKLLFAAHTEAGLAIQTSDGEAVPGAELSRVFSAAIRPQLPAHLTSNSWYFPALSQHPDLIAHINHHPALKLLAETSLVLACCRLEGLDAPAVGWGDVASLDAIYFDGIEAPDSVEVEEVL